MNKKCKVIIFFSFLFLVLEQQAMFRNSFKILNPKSFEFSENFLKKAYQNRSLIKKIQIFLQEPLEPSIENELFRFRCEDNVKVNIAVTGQVASIQKKMLQEIKNEGASVLCLPEEYNLLSWEPVYNKEGLWTGQVNFVKSKKPSFAQIALFSYYTQRSRVAIFSKNNKDVVLSECFSLKENIDKVEEAFDTFFCKDAKEK